MYRQWVTDFGARINADNAPDVFRYYFDALHMSQLDLIIFYSHFCKMLRYKFLPYVSGAYKCSWPDYGGFDYCQVLSAAETSSSEGYTITTSSSDPHAEERALMRLVSRMRPPPPPPNEAAAAAQDDPLAASGIKTIHCGAQKVLVWPSGPTDVVRVHEDPALSAELEDCWMYDSIKSTFLFLLVCAKLVLQHISTFFFRNRRARVRRAVRALRRQRENLKRRRQETLHRALEGDYAATMAVNSEPHLYALIASQATSESSECDKDDGTASGEEVESEQERIVKANVIAMIESQVNTEMNKTYGANYFHFVGLAEMALTLLYPVVDDALFGLLHRATTHLHSVVTYPSAAMRMRHGYWATRETQCSQFLNGWVHDAAGDLNRYLQMGETLELLPLEITDTLSIRTERSGSLATLLRGARGEYWLTGIAAARAALVAAHVAPSPRVQPRRPVTAANAAASASVTVESGATRGLAVQRRLSERITGLASRSLASGVSRTSSLASVSLSSPHVLPRGPVSKEEREYDEAQWHRLLAMIGTRQSPWETNSPSASGVVASSGGAQRKFRSEEYPLPTYLPAKTCAELVEEFKSCQDARRSLIAWLIAHRTERSFDDLMPQEVLKGKGRLDMRHRRLAPSCAKHEVSGLLRIMKNGVRSSSSSSSRNARGRRRKPNPPKDTSHSGSDSGSSASSRSTSQGSRSPSQNSRELPATAGSILSDVMAAAANAMGLYDFGLDDVLPNAEACSLAAGSALSKTPASALPSGAESEALTLETTVMTILSPAGEVLQLELCDPLPMPSNATLRYQCNLCCVSELTASFQAVVYDSVRYQISFYDECDGFDVCLVCAVHLFREAARRLLAALHPDPRQRRPFEHGTDSRMKIWAMEVSRAVMPKSPPIWHVRLRVGVSPLPLRVVAWHVSRPALRRLAAALGTGGDNEDNNENDSVDSGSNGGGGAAMSKLERIIAALPVPPPYWSRACVVTHAPLTDPDNALAQPAHKFDESELCVICMQPLLGQIPTIETVCHHWFHIYCLMNLRNFHDEHHRSNACPVCRSTDYYPASQTPAQLVRSNTYNLELLFWNESQSTKEQVRSIEAALARQPQLQSLEEEFERARQVTDMLDESVAFVKDVTAMGTGMSRTAQATTEDDDEDCQYIAVCSLMDKSGVYHNPTNIAACRLLKVYPSMLYAEDEQSAK